MAPNKSCNALCAVGAVLTAASIGGLAVFAFAARGVDDDIDLGTVLDASVLVTTLTCTTTALWWFSRLVMPLWKDLQAIRWELKRTRQELHETRQEFIAAQPTAQAIAGYAITDLVTALAVDEDEGAEVVNLRG